MLADVAFSWLRWVAGALLAAASLTVHAQAMRVSAITIAGQPADRALEVVVLTAEVPAGERRILRLHEALPAGVEIVAPARTVIVFVSINGNEITLEAGARVRIGDVTAAGERYGVTAGRATFNVLNALSFFNVVFEEFVALVGAGLLEHLASDRSGLPSLVILDMWFDAATQERRFPHHGRRARLTAAQVKVMPRSSRWTRAGTSMPTTCRDMCSRSIATCSMGTATPCFSSAPASCCIGCSLRSRMQGATSRSRSMREFACPRTGDTRASPTTAAVVQQLQDLPDLIGAIPMRRHTDAPVSC